MYGVIVLKAEKSLKIKTTNIGRGINGVKSLKQIKIIVAVIAKALSPITGRSAT